MTPQVLSELRLLASARFDSQRCYASSSPVTHRLTESCGAKNSFLGQSHPHPTRHEFASRDELLPVSIISPPVPATSA